MTTSSTSLQRIAVAGADGKMGQTLLHQCLMRQQTMPDRIKLSAAMVVADSPWRDKTVGSLLGNDCPIVFTADHETAIHNSDVLIDFTRPLGTMTFLKLCLSHQVSMVIGTTGLDDTQRHTLTQAAQKIPMLISSNMAPGVNALFYLVEKAAKMLKHYDAEIVEMHHRHKVDAPSGTALTLGERIITGRSSEDLSDPQSALSKVADFTRYGHIGPRNTQGKERIGFSVIRGGDVVGEHTALFIGEGERLELRHVSTQRTHYAYGALEAACFLHQRTPGIYHMDEVLGLKNTS